MTFTLPAAGPGVKGWWYDFRVHANQSLIVAVPAANTLVTPGDVTADNVGFQTTNKKIGRGLRVVCDGTSWFAFPQGALDGFNIDGVEVAASFASGSTIASPSFTGPVQTGAAAAAVGGSTELINSKVLANNTAVDFFTITVPNQIAGAMVLLTVTSALGDGDSTDSALYTFGISRVAAANAKMVASTKSVVGATAGAGANAVITAAASSVTGAAGAVNTFTITVKNARSAGAADNHPTTAIARLVNLTATGVTIAAA